MNQEPEIKEVDLIKVKVIKKKHLEGLREFRYKLDFSKLKMLGYISEWDSILYQDLETEHYGVTPAINYYTHLQEGLKQWSDWKETNENAHKFVHSLPQLFLD